METLRLGLRCGWLLTVALLLARPAQSAPLSTEIDEGLRRRALALNDITGDDPVKGQIQLLVAEPAETRKLLDAAVAMAQDPKKQPFNHTAAHILAMAADDPAIKHYDAAKVFFRICADQAKKLKSAHKLALAYIGLTDVLFKTKEYAESEKVCQQFLSMEDEEGQPYKIFMMQYMIQAIAKQGRKKEALKLADDYIKVRKDWRGYKLKATVEHELAMYKEAAANYEKTLDYIKKAKELKDPEKAEEAEEVRYILSNVYLEMNNIDKAAENLKACLKEKPDSPTYNNDLGYIWADHDMNLDEAEKMIRKAIDEERKQRRKENPDVKAEEEEDNAAYLDSLGWVLFKKKKYKEALEPLLKAAEMKDGQHIEILDHLAEVHNALGEKEKALAAWKKGVETAGKSKREQEKKAQVEKKIKANE